MNSHGFAAGSKEAAMKYLNAGVNGNDVTLLKEQSKNE